MNASLHDSAREAAEAIGKETGPPPLVAIVLGSGLGELVDTIQDPITLPYGQIPHFPKPTVAGHLGHYVVGSIGSVRVAAFQGRFHSYEGHDLAAVTFPIRVLQALGVPRLILTAATGGVRESLRPGDLVCVSDHLNLIGANPLRGPNDERLGPRFLDLTEVYSKRLRSIAAEVARDEGIGLSEGVYAALPGPSYETPAEVRMLRTLGADVVGMSTVPEAIVARHAGIEVLAFALVTNAAAGITGSPITHQEVLDAGVAAARTLSCLIRGVIRNFPTG